MAFFQMLATGLSIIAPIMQGEAQGRAANRAGDLAFANARNTRQMGGVREEAQRRSNALDMGNIRASAAQSGFDPSSGSLASLQASSAAEMELDALTTRYESELQAISFENQGRSLRAQAKTIRRTGYLNAAGEVFSAGAKMFGEKRIGAPAPVETRIPTPTGRY